MGSFCSPPYPGHIAFLQRLHHINLQAKATMYLYHTQQHMKMAQAAGVQHIKVFTALCFFIPLKKGIMFLTWSLGLPVCVSVCHHVSGEMASSRLQFTARCDKTRQNSFFFPNEKERKLCKKKRRVEKERGRGGAARCLTFFKCIINSLSALVLHIILPQMCGDEWGIAVAFVVTQIRIVWGSTIALFVCLSTFSLCVRWWRSGKKGR